MKKKLLTLAKGLDFETESDYFEYCIDSHINGNFTQCERLFEDMRQQDKKVFLNYMNGQAQFNGYIDTRNFYFNLL